ncbi:GIY-YIG nuclease family protein [Mesorhizobium sp.]|nr:GIY-YIG nuclease family protein [Mesorhizobium sp.]
MTASQKRGTIYIGVTNDLGRRMPEHKSGQGSRFTSRYGSSFFAEPGGRRSVLSRCILRLISRNGSQGLRASLRSLLRPRMTKWRGVSANPRALRFATGRNCRRSLPIGLTCQNYCVEAPRAKLTDLSVIGVFDHMR